MNQNKNKLRYIEKLKASEDIYIEKKKIEKFMKSN